jgi:hypothetical protein
MDYERRRWSDEFDDEANSFRGDPARRIVGPAVGLIIVGALGIMGFCVWLIVLSEVRRSQPPAPPPPNVDQAAFKRGQAAAPAIDACLIGVPTLAVYGLTLAGGIAMLRRQGRGLAITAAILAMLPCGVAFLVGLPVGIWALVVLFNPDVADAFRRPRSRRRRDDY